MWELVWRRKSSKPAVVKIRELLHSHRICGSYMVGKQLILAQLIPVVIDSHHDCSPAMIDPHHERSSQDDLFIEVHSDQSWRGWIVTGMNRDGDQLSRGINREDQCNARSNCSTSQINVFSLSKEILFTPVSYLHVVNSCLCGSETTLKKEEFT